MKPETTKTKKQTNKTWPAIHRSTNVQQRRQRAGDGQGEQKISGRLTHLPQCTAPPRGPTISRVKERRVRLAVLFVNIYVIVATQMKA